MAVANIIVYCGEGGWSVKDVNRFSDTMSKNRQWESHDGIELAKLVCLTQEDESLFYNQVTVKPVEPAYEGFWNTVHCFEYGFQQFHGDSKIVVLPQPTVALDLVGIPLLESAPERGTTENAAKTISEEDKQMVKDQQLFPIQQFDNWWNDETDMSPFWIGDAASTGRWIFNEFTESYDTIVEDYDSNAYGFQQYLECELEDKLFYLNHAHGINAPYTPHDTATQLERNEIWESQVRPWFSNDDDGYGWRGLGGDEEALLFEYDHEYRAVSRQCSFITFEGDTDDLESDEYVRWWML